MSQIPHNISGLADLAYRALNGGDSAYVHNKALIHDVFCHTRGFPHREEVRLTLVDSMYSTQVAARRLYGISDIAEKLRRAFTDDTVLKDCAAQWIQDGFTENNPLYGIFAADYGTDKSGRKGEAAPSLLSKYLYFATDYSFPIYDALGAKYHFIAPVTPALRKSKKPDFQNRFITLTAVNKKYAVNDFDKLDALFWLCGKISAGSYSLVLNKERYVRLFEYLNLPPKETGENIKTGINKHIRNSGGPLPEILGKELYGFILQIQDIKE
jgi:hypothetical protein